MSLLKDDMFDEAGGGRGGGCCVVHSCVVLAVLLCLVLSGVNEHDNTLQRYCHVHSLQTR